MERIFLYKEFGSNILIRRDISSFFKKNIDRSKSKEVVLDFKNIRFISRSCAVEYLKLREETAKNLIEKNMSEEVKSMFSLVTRQLKNIDFVFKKETPVIGKKLK